MFNTLDKICIFLVVHSSLPHVATLTIFSFACYIMHFIKRKMFIQFCLITLPYTMIQLHTPAQIYLPDIFTTCLTVKTVVRSYTWPIMFHDVMEKYNILLKLPLLYIYDVFLFTTPKGKLSKCKKCKPS